MYSRLTVEFEQYSSKGLEILRCRWPFLSWQVISLDYYNWSSGCLSTTATYSTFIEGRIAICSTFVISSNMGVGKVAHFSSKIYSNWQGGTGIKSSVQTVVFVSSWSWPADNEFLVDVLLADRRNMPYFAFLVAGAVYWKKRNERRVSHLYRIVIVRGRTLFVSLARSLSSFALQDSGLGLG